MTVTKRTWFLETGFGKTQLTHDPANGDPATVGDKFGFIFIGLIPLILWTLFRTLIWPVLAVVSGYDLSENPSHWWDWIFMVVQVILFFRSLHPVKIGSDKFGLTTTEDKS